MSVAIVEPDPRFRRVLLFEMVEAGYAPVMSDSFEAALSAAIRSPPTVIVVDATADPAGGADFIRLACSHERLKSVPVICIASVTGSEQVLLDAGAVCCIRSIADGGALSKAVRWASSVYAAVREDASTREAPPDERAAAGICR